MNKIASPLSLDGPQFATIGRIPVEVHVVLGATKMPIADLMALRRDAVISLDRRIGEPVDLVVNGRIVARGDLQIVDDDEGRFGISITEIVGADHSGNGHSHGG